MNYGVKRHAEEQKTWWHWKENGWGWK